MNTEDEVPIHYVSCIATVTQNRITIVKAALVCIADDKEAVK